jgi:hypothetical protein
MTSRPTAFAPSLRGLKRSLGGFCQDEPHRDPKTVYDDDYRGAGVATAASQYVGRRGYFQALLEYPRISGVTQPALATMPRRSRVSWERA